MFRRTSKGISQTDEPMSLDSLLDTLMCIVGVSLVLLAASQLQMIKAKQKLTSDAIPSEIPSRVKSEQERAAKLADRLKALQKKWQRRTDVDRARKKERQELLTRLEALRGEPERLRRLKEHLAGTRQIEKKLNDELPGLKMEIQDIRGEIDRLQRVIANAQPATTIHLPVRRALQKELDPVTFVCRYGQVYPLDYAQLGEVLFTEARNVIASFSQSTSPDQRIQRLVSHFDSGNIGNRYFRLKLQGLLDGQEFAGFIIRMEPRKNGRGETLEEAIKPASHFVKTVEQVDPASQYVRFMVWSDSFDHYLALRRKVERLHSSEDDSNTRVGLSWTPYAHDEEIEEFWDILQKYKNRGKGKKSGTTIDN